MNNQFGMITQFFPTLSIGILSFISTHMDNLLVLMILFSNQNYSIYQIVLGQYVGLLFLVSVSWISSILSSQLLPGPWVSILGLFPLLLGVFKLIQSKKNSDNSIVPSQTKQRILPDAFTKILSVFMIVIAAGGDNIAIYTPLFASCTREEIVILIITYLIFTSFLCILANFLISRKTYGESIRYYSDLIFPYFLIGLGAFLLVKTFI